MRRFQLGLAMFALPLFACTLFLAGCGKDDKKDTASSSSSSDNKDVTKPSGELKALVASKGHLKGEISLKGSPDLEGRTKELLAQIEQKEDKAKCLMGSESEKTEQTYRIGSNKKVGNVFVWLVPDKGTYFKIDDKQLEEAKKHPVHLHQPHCAFIPHCSVLFAKYAPDPKKPRDLKSTGQIVTIKNDADMTHNTKWGDGGAKNPGDNKTLPKGEQIKVENLVPSTTHVSIGCTIHPWMNAYMRVFDHPYATVSLSDTLDGDNKVKSDDPKFGTFELKNLPVGKMRIVAWHETGVYLNEGGGNGQPIEIKEGEPTVVNFDLTAK